MENFTPVSTKLPEKWDIWSWKWEDQNAAAVIGAVLEALAGRQALFKKIQTLVKEGQKTVLTDSLGPDLADMRSGDIRKAIRRGDKMVERVVEEAAEYIGIGIANLMNVLNPEVIVLGGGVIDALEDEMMAIIVETAHDYSLSGTDKGVDIIASKLGDDAGIVGGAVLAKRETK